MITERNIGSAFAHREQDACFAVADAEPAAIVRQPILGKHFQELQQILATHSFEFVHNFIEHGKLLRDLLERRQRVMQRCRPPMSM